METLFDPRHAGCEILIGDALRELDNIPSDSFRCCVTSPPYWGLRDYDVDGQIGAEMVLDDYIRNLTYAFRKVHRVLAEDGSLWLNLGDGYTSGGRTWRAPDKKNPARSMNYRPPTPEGLKPKDLLGVPWRLAFALQSDGWYLRSEIIWHKPNAQPESVKDRPARSHEHLFLLSKSERYFYNHDAVKVYGADGKRRNLRTVWSLNTEAFPEAHFATFPPALVEPCVRAGSERGDTVLDPFFGSGTVGVVCAALGRKFVGIELNSEYASIAEKRLGWKVQDATT